MAEKLEKWLERRGFDLEMEDGADDSVCFTTKSVAINSRVCESTQLATLLHECGHVDVYHSRLKDKRKKVAGSTYRQFVRNCGDSRRERALGVRIGIVDEEIEAWDRGEAIAKRLKIKYSKKLYQLLRTKSLMTYFRWTAGVKNSATAAPKAPQPRGR